MKKQMNIPGYPDPSDSFPIVVDIDNQKLQSIPEWFDSAIECPGHEFVVACEKHWKNVSNDVSVY